MSRGFTLLELLVVLAIIALLSAMVAPRYLGRIEQTKGQVARAQIDMLDKGVIQYRLDTGTLPSAAAGFGALLAQPPGLEGWEGPYVKQLPADPWDHPYVYRTPGADGRDFDIVSYGEDGVFGGSGAAADIDNIR